MTVTSEAYREVMRHFPSGVTIVTIKTGSQIHGLTVSAFTSVSPEPPLILVAIDRRHLAEALLRRPDAVFAVNILAADQDDLSNRFAWVKDDDRFAAGSWTTAATGAPILSNALAWLDCTIANRFDAGTHSIYIGEIQASAVPRLDELPLIYWNRGYRKIQRYDPPRPDDE